MGTPEQDRVSKHYGTDDLEQRILAALESDGKDRSSLSVDDLAAVDAFHVRGRVATEELAELAGIGSGKRVLDVGSGLGGTARYLAASRDCDVVGLDLTPEYCEVAGKLSARVGLDGRTRFRQGSALEMPFRDGEFDIVWTEHVQMNIADKARFYREMARVMAPDGRMAFHDFFSGDPGELRFPVPWAGDAGISHLAAVDDVPALLEGLGLEPVHWVDQTAPSIAFLRTSVARIGTEQAPAVGLHLLTGAETREKFVNVLANLEDGLLRVIQAVLRRA